MVVVNGLHLHLGYALAFVAICFAAAFGVARFIRNGHGPREPDAPPTDFGANDISRTQRAPSMPPPGYSPLMSEPPPIPDAVMWKSRKEYK